jgi:hypothetical protein
MSKLLNIVVLGLSSLLGCYSTTTEIQLKDPRQVSVEKAGRELLPESSTPEEATLLAKQLLGLDYEANVVRNADGALSVQCAQRCQNVRSETPLVTEDGLVVAPYLQPNTASVGLSTASKLQIPFTYYASRHNGHASTLRAVTPWSNVQRISTQKAPVLSVSPLASTVFFATGVASLIGGSALIVSSLDEVPRENREARKFLFTLFTANLLVGSTFSMVGGWGLMGPKSEVNIYP